MTANQTPQKALDLHKQGRTHEAALMLDSIHEKNGTTLPVEHARAWIASDINRHDIALQYWSNCAMMKPDNHDYWYNWALCLDKIKRRNEAKDICREAMARFPKSDMLCVMMGIMTNDPKYYRRALELNPDNATAMTNLGSFVSPEEAERLFTRAVEIDPTNPYANVGIARILFGRGEYKKAWEHYEHRKHDYMASAIIRSDAKPWRGERINGKTVSVICEQGIGDEVLYLTGLGVLRGASQVIVSCDPRIVDLVQRACPWADVEAYQRVKVGDMEERICSMQSDYYLSCGDLWRYTDERTNSLFVPRGMKFDKPTIGICWRSGLEGRAAWPGVDWAIALVRDYPQWQFVNLQYNCTDAELDQLQEYDNFLNLDVDLYNDIGINCEIALGCEYVFGPATAPMMFAKCCGANAVMLDQKHWWRGMFPQFKSANHEEIREMLCDTNQKKL